MAYPTIDEILNTTYASTDTVRRPAITNAIFEKTRFLTFMAASGRAETGDSGRQIEGPVLMAESGAASFFNEDGDVSTEGADPLRMWRDEWRYVAAPVKKIYTQIHKNSGKSQIINIAKQMIKTANATMSAKLEEAILGDGTIPNGCNGLQQLIATDPTAAATVESIPQATNSWWQNQTRAAGGTSATTYLQNELNKLYIDCSKFGPEPNVHICDRNLYERYQMVQDDRHIVIDKKMTDLGWPDTLTFKGAPVIWSSKAETDVWRMVNIDHLYMYYDPKAWLVFNGFKSTTDNLNEVGHVICVFNMITDNRIVNGALTGITAE